MVYCHLMTRLVWIRNSDHVGLVAASLLYVLRCVLQDVCLQSLAWPQQVLFSMECMTS
jgi:hypothetical protein